MNKYLVKSKFGLGRDFAVYTDEEATNKAFTIDAKIGFGTKAEIKDSNENTIYTAKGKVINIPRKMEFLNPEGSSAAILTAHFSPIKSRLTMVLADGTKWELAGNIVGKNYTVKENDSTIIQINQKWVTIRDKYFVEISENIDTALAIGLVWAVDVWREGKNN